MSIVFQQAANVPAMNVPLTKSEIHRWLRETDPGRLAELWARANDVRRRHVGDEVYLRGLVEISSFCSRQCLYCGLRAGNRTLARYRMSPKEILDAARQAVRFGYGTVVLQGGEDYGLTGRVIAEVIQSIKAEMALAVTLSLGERPDRDLVAWRKAGADRYLLRFETSDPNLFEEIHPPHGKRPNDRVALLRRLKELGYETGSGIMVGIPGQTFASVANDILLFRELDLDMIGIGPFIRHPATPLGSGFNVFPPVNGEQVPNTELMVYKAVALTRLMRPDANIPATTALATINQVNGRELGLERGANVLMPNLTPMKYRRLYEIYPNKACIAETDVQCKSCLGARIHALGRRIGTGPGGRWTRRPRVDSAEGREVCHA
jgi:biotin synthase